MIYDIHSPSEELLSIVKQYMVINSLDGINKLLFLPNGCNFIVFNRGLTGYTKVYRESKQYQIPQKYSVSVKSNKVREFVLDKEFSISAITFPIILVELTPVGFYKLFNKNASMLNSGYLEIEQDIVDMYFSKLYENSSIESEIEYLNNSLKCLQMTQSDEHIAIEDIIKKINFYHYEVSVESLIEEFGCSRSTMERDFKKIVGLTPKNFIFIAKFCKTVLSYIEDECTFKELEYFYSDNSYMNAVFKKFLGVSPSVILNQVADNKIRIYQMQKNRI